MHQRAGATLLLATAACSAAAPDASRAPVVGALAPIDAATADTRSDAEPAGGRRGAACTPSEASPAGTCGDGLFCLPPAPGGLCTSFCGADGVACDGVCTTSSRAGNLCLAGCQGDADCRIDEGYVCDPIWKACALPGLLAPIPPTCRPSPPLERGAFGASERLSTTASPGLYQFEPSAAVTTDGTLVALYSARRSQGQPSQLAAARISADGQRSYDLAVPSSKTSHFDPWLAAGRDGQVHAVWLAFDNTRAPEVGAIIGYARSRDGGASWTTPAPVHDAAGDCPAGTLGCLDKPMVAVGPDVGGSRRRPAGEVVYVGYSSTVRDGMRVVASRDGGTTWSSSVTATPGIYGDLEVDATGAVHAVALDGGPAGGPTSADNKVSYAVSRDGGTSFSPPSVVSRPGERLPFFFSNPNVSVDTRRKRIHVVYPHGSADGAWDIVLATSADGGRTWRHTTVNDDGHCASHMLPQVVVDEATGEVHVAWYDQRDGAGAVAYAVCRGGGATCGKNQLLSDTPFASYSYVRHGTGWLGEYWGLVLDPRRRMLHAVWTQPVAEPRGAISRIFHAQAKL